MLITTLTISETLEIIGITIMETTTTIGDITIETMHELIICNMIRKTFRTPELLMLRGKFLNKWNKCSNLFIKSKSLELCHPQN